ncbi:bifunctional proline dehydrogenase/L-glutamate gamma-semialdehyde dehydrogenase [Nocardioides sp. SYSU D00038]|uniref:bifunctional proline dehydrogenase/L-glutamate gamma-semialdehyde dehydrogenase n=1 Tax=Nocardioides sp. SYSU D00038 TaxID=2812554 RepID=UPI001967EB5B|nr:bifunctional proline dehydrogenase/L-glutamate gamma-semialdehyde dehydrogenase [Nocardioides sp. SYSU D00038]
MTGLAPEVVETVRRWLAEAAAEPVDPAARKLAGLLKDPRGLDFTVGFIDGVIRPEDPRVAAATFADLARDVPRFLPWHLRQAVRIGGLAGRVAPGLVIPVVRRVLRSMVGHLVVDARDRQLGRTLARLRDQGTRLNLNLLGEAVLGEREAARRLEGTHRLLARDDVDYVSIKVSATVAPHSPWAFDEAVDHIVDSLGPLFRRAAAASPKKFINLDMEEYRDLDLTVAVFTRLLDQPDLLDLEAGIVLQAYLPDALRTMIRLQEWAADRRARGGAGIKVRLVKGANLPMERVEAELHGWPLATWHSKQDSDTSYKAVLDYALHPERVRNVRLGVAGHNLFDVAFAWLLAGRRGVRDEVELEMLLGMAPGQAAAVRREVGSLLLYTPVVHPAEFDVAIAYLIRRLEEGASRENFMSAVFDLHSDPALFERERDRFLASLHALDRTVPEPHRVQDRRHDDPQPMTGFANVPDTDPALPGNAAWGREVLGRVPGSRLGVDAVEAHTLTTDDQLDDVLTGAVEAGRAWGALPGAGRAAVLHRAAVELERRRGDLLEVMAAECGKTLDQADPEVSEAVDFANYYAERAAELDAIDGAVARPVGLTVVTPPWNFPVAIPAGSTLAALAAGSAVVVKPAGQARRCGAVMVEALWAAGVPREVLRLAVVGEDDLGRRLVADPRVGRLVLTGGYETAELFRSFRRDLPLLAETSGKNAVVVTPSADLDLAARDVASSAFGHAGQKCSAASLVILVGSVARSTRFRNQLVDAVTSLRVGPPSDPTSQVGPLIEPASGKLLRALTTLEPGERWLVEPHRLDEEGRLWSPGVKEGVAPGSPFHLTEYFGPVLGIMTAETVEEAVALQNQVAYGLTAGLHSLDPEELALWLERVEAGNLYVNRGTTGAIVRRQPFGGWKRSAVGTGTKAGGPSYVLGLTDWASAPATATAAVPSVTAPLLAAARAAGLDGTDRLERALRSDAAAWTGELGTVRDVSGLAAERNVLRHLPHPVTVRHEPDAPVVDLVRVVAAGVLAGAPTTVSAAVALPDGVHTALTTAGVEVVAEDAETWAARLAGMPGGRVRLVGGDPAAAYAASGGRPDVAVHAQPVTEAGRIELLPFLREQAVSITAHRFGTPNHLSDDVLPLVDPAPVP